MPQRKICIVTGSRAEYGHLYWLLKAVKDDPGMALQVVVTGSHLSSAFGSTVDVIRQDGFVVSGKVDVLSPAGKEMPMTRAISRGIDGFSGVYKRLKPDVVVVLGDRYEIFAAAVAAYVARIPLAHIHGGEVTGGALDEAFRHALTKMAGIHFPASKLYAQWIRRMGESPERVFMYGAPGMDNMKHLKFLSKGELARVLGISGDRPLATVTYHPVTLEHNTAGKQMESVFLALDKFDGDIVFTMPNADTGHSVIVNKIKSYVKKNSGRARAFTSLGHIRYLSLLKRADIMIGNSSSGIVEAPSFKLPVVNIGDRQRGRVKARNVIDCGSAAADITKAIQRGLSGAFRKSLRGMKNPYGCGGASMKIKEKLKHIRIGADFLKKEFFDA